LSLCLADHFIIDGKSGRDLITEGQLHIFSSIIFRDHKRVEIICSTQYGKTLWVALAAIIVSCVQGKKVCIVAPSAEKAKLTMRYYIEHLGDNKMWPVLLEKNTKLDRLKQEENKERIMLNNDGGIFILSAQQRNANKSIEAAMGAGAEIVIGDEYNLITDNTEATIFRMIAGKGPEAFYCKIGNPFYSSPPYSHFKKSWYNPRYHRIFIDGDQGLKEGRYTKEFLDEAKEKPLYEILFGCEFPPEDTMDDRGYRPLILSDSLKYGVTEDLMLELINNARKDGKLKIKPKLGGDIGGGGDKNVFVVRWGKFACVAGTNQSKDTMANISIVEEIVARFWIDWTDVNIDDIGIGRGVTDRLKEKGYNVCGVSVGDPAQDKETYSNLKAELSWKAKIWVEKDDSRLDERNEWNQCTWIKYKVDSDKKVKIESKQDLKKRTSGKSPDFWDALVLTFYDKPFEGFI